MDITAIGCVYVHWNKLVLVRNQLRALLNVIMNLWHSGSLERNLVTSSRTVRFSRMVLFYLVLQLLLSSLVVCVLSLITGLLLTKFSINLKSLKLYSIRKILVLIKKCIITMLVFRVLKPCWFASRHRWKHYTYPKRPYLRTNSQGVTIQNSSIFTAVWEIRISKCL